MSSASRTNIKGVARLKTRKVWVGLVAVAVGAGCVAATVFFRSSGDTVPHYDKSVKITVAGNSIEQTYRQAVKSYRLPVYAGADLTFGADEMSDAAAALYGGSSPSVLIEQGKTVDFKVTLPQDALYCVRVEYYDDSDSVLPTKLGIQVDGAYPFYEMRDQQFLSKWVFASKTVSADRYGNEITPDSQQAKAWNTAYLRDASALTDGPFQLELKAGTHTFSLTCEQGKLAVASLTFTALPKAGTISTGTPQGGELVVLPGEDISYKNDSTIRPVGEYNTALTPYSASHLVLNMLDGNSFDTGGQAVSYSFTVQKAGYYYIGFRYCQSVQIDFPVFRDVWIDDSLPTPDFQSVAFSYSRKYKNLTVSDSSGKPVGIYLTAGEHTLTLSVTLAPVAGILDELQTVGKEVNALSLEVSKITGNNANKYRDFDLSESIPGLRDMLLSWADRLGQIYEELHAFNPNARQIGAFSSLLVCKRQLISLAQDPDELPTRIDELSEGQSSVAQYLADVMEDLYSSPLALDESYVYQNADSLPKPAGLFKSISDSVLRFCYSFERDDYEVSGAGSTKNLQVWVARSQLYAQTLQTLADETFTPQTTGYSVDVSIITDTSKLVLANTAGSAPDVSLGIDSSLPFNLAVRCALKDLNEYDDIGAITPRFESALLNVGTIGTHLYSLPETCNFFVLFYRSDILNNFGLTVPDTMDEVKAMLPKLRSRGMNFYSNISGNIGFKPFSATLPILYQMGGNVYGKTAQDIELDSDTTLDAFTEMTNLFTIYGLSYEVPNFYQHFRDGTMPIGISDFGTYNLLVNSAPEIADSWSIAPVPGYKDKNGVTQRWMTGSAENAIIFKDTQKSEQAWDFLKWWTSAGTQLKYANTLQVSYGKEYMWPTANREAFALLPWKEGDKKVILDETKWVFEAPHVPGSYMTEREIGNAFQKVVLNGVNVRTAMDTAVKNIRYETNRKQQEFGYMKGSTILQPFVLPTDPRTKQTSD